MPHLASILRHYHVGRIARQHGFIFQLQHAKEIPEIPNRIYRYEFDAVFRCKSADGTCDPIGLKSELFASLRRKLIVLTHWKSPYLCRLVRKDLVHEERKKVLIYHMVMTARRVFTASQHVSKAFRLGLVRRNTTPLTKSASAVSGVHHRRRRRHAHSLASPGSLYASYASSPRHRSRLSSSSSTRLSSRRSATPSTTRVVSVKPISVRRSAPARIATTSKRSTRPSARIAATSKRTSRKSTPASSRRHL